MLTGTVNVNAGTIQVASAMTNSGLIDVAAGATFRGNNASPGARWSSSCARVQI